MFANHLGIKSHLSKHSKCQVFWEMSVYFNLFSTTKKKTHFEIK